MDTDRRTVRRRTTCALVVALPLLTLAPPSPDPLAAGATPTEQASTREPIRAPSEAAPPIADPTAPEPAIRLADPVTGASLSVPAGADPPDPADLPSTALRAYLFAARTIDTAAPRCGLDWSLLAAIGSVESDHGRAGGRTLGPDGVPSRVLRGVRLDGTGSTPRVVDTDAGVLDGDRRYDRPVGPMQLLPATWATVGVDADGDGVRDVHDLDDAALGAAVFLCSGPGTLRTADGLRSALRSYNSSQTYADTVLERAAAYRAAGRTDTDTDAVALTLRARPAPNAAPETGAPVRPAPDTAPADTPTKTKTKLVTPVEVIATPVPQQQPKPVRPPPAAEPAPEPAPEPVDPPPPSGPVELRGTLLACAAGWCLDDQPLDVGDPAFLATPAGHDLDGDGVVGTNQAELEGLAGTAVVLEAEVTDDRPLVRSVNGQAYRPAAIY